MGEFFKGWRRKAGLVTLVMACVLTAVWMRSYGRPELYWIPAANWDCVVYSSNGGFEVGFEEGNIFPDFRGWYGWKSLGIDVWENPGAVPYWSLVLPLTLLSAWLILGKRRKRTQRGIDS